MHYGTRHLVCKNISFKTDNLAADFLFMQTKLMSFDSKCR